MDGIGSGAYLTNSLVVTFFSVAIAVVAGALGAYVIARFRLPFAMERKVGLFLLTLRIVPPVVILIPVYLLMLKLGLLDSWLGLIATYTAFNITFCVWMMESFFREIPVDLEVVYQTLFKLRNAVGETVGANYDPSHPLWMGADPIAGVRTLGSAIYYVHAKDTRIEPTAAAIDGTLDPRPPNLYAERAWNYITLGYGHGETWWRQFCTALKQVGYDDVLSIEHEDMMLTPMEGMR
ncbi:TIM barrel protein, partial [Mesorhizobium sp. SARCC-RB16n]|uniref:TIM barrel protein n=1 Tax=Mesorhizobium sp. SARCC-RB16n TaxID=2116687 RepID=UPI001FEECCE9